GSTNAMVSTVTPRRRSRPWRTRGARTAGASLVAVGLVVSGCSSGSGSATSEDRSTVPESADAADMTDTAIDDAWVAVLRAELAADGSPFPQHAVACLASALVAALGPSGVFDRAAAPADGALLADAADLAAVDGAALGAGVL